MATPPPTWTPADARWLAPEQSPAMAPFAFRGAIIDSTIETTTRR